MEKNSVESWLTIIKVAIDPNSPFKGLVDLREIFNLPLSTQHKIHDAMTEDERAQLALVYGSAKGEVA
jgi:hypothetical protein